MADDLVAQFLGVVSCPGAVEVLDVLDEGPRSLAELRRSARLSRRRIDRAIRVLAAEGVLRRSGEQGSWDAPPVPEALFELTATGRRVAAELSEIDVWTAVYEYYLRDFPGL